MTCPHCNARSTEQTITAVQSDVNTESDEISQVLNSSGLDRMLEFPSTFLHNLPVQEIWIHLLETLSLPLFSECQILHGLAPRNTLQIPQTLCCLGFQESRAFFGEQILTGWGGRTNSFRNFAWAIPGTTPSTPASFRGPDSRQPPFQLSYKDKYCFYIEFQSSV